MCNKTVSGARRKVPIVLIRFVVYAITFGFALDSLARAADCYESAAWIVGVAGGGVLSFFRLPFRTAALGGVLALLGSAAVPGTSGIVELLCMCGGAIVGALIGRLTTARQRWGWL